VAALPWELLYSDDCQAFIGTRIKTPLVRYLDMAQARGDLRATCPIRLLVLIPAGSESAPLNVAKERSIIDAAVSGLGPDIEVTYLADRFADRRVTWQRITEYLAQHEAHCIHFIGHGAFRDDRGFLVLDSEHGGDESIDDEQFAELFVNSPNVKLVVLNACNGATRSSSRPLTGSAARLVLRGVPAVVAMQFSVLDDAAIAFCRCFYNSLFHGPNTGRVDVAVSHGRHMLAARFADQRELAAPVLFLHTRGDVVLVPEKKGLLANFPTSADHIDTLRAAQKATPSEREAAAFRRRITIAKQAVRTSLAATLVLFCLSAIRVLDLFTIDTQAEFAVMALGNGLAEHKVNEQLRVLTIDGTGLSTEALRRRTADTIRALADVGAATVALDMYFRAEEGGFKTDPASAPPLVSAIRESRVPVVIGAIDAAGTELEVPDALRSATAATGYICHESKLGLARSLPMSALKADIPYSSFALAAVATFRGANLLPAFVDGAVAPVLTFTEKPSVRFAVSEINEARRRVPTCPLIQDGDLVAHRFIRQTPGDLIAARTITDEQLQARLAADPAGTRAAFAGALVLLGVLGRGDIVHDLAGTRDGVLWQADAINNLLQDDLIVPVRDRYQLALMLLLAGATVAGTLRYAGQFRPQLAVVVGLCVLVGALAVALYGWFDVLITPAYCILAVLSAWWIARRFGRNWLRE